MPVIACDPLLKLRDRYFITDFTGCFSIEFYKFLINEREEGGNDDASSKCFGKLGDAEARAAALRDEYNYVTFEEQEQNISAVLGGKKLKVTETTHNRFFDYLDENIKYPCILTGVDDLSWKEPNLSGFFSQKEYNELKKIIPSFTNRYKLKSLEGIDDLRGILVKVKRIGDKKTFILPLWDLKTAERKDPNHQMIDDYSYWMSNYR